MNKRVLVLNNRGMGDCIVSVMAFPYIRELLGEVDIHFGVHEKHAGLFQHDIFSKDKGGYAFSTFGVDYRSIKGIVTFYKAVKRIKPDYILELCPVRRVGKVVKLLKWIDPTLKFEFLSSKSQELNIPNDFVGKNILQTSLNDIWWAIGKEKNSPPSYVKYQQNVVEKKGYFVMSMASSSFDHLCKPEDFLKLIIKVKTHFKGVEIIYPLSKSKVDQTMKQKLIELGAPVTFVEKPLKELPLYFSDAIMFIGMDTGIKHLSAYMGVPTFTLIPVKSYPYSHSYNDEKHKAISIDTPFHIIEEELDATINGLSLT